jgi:protein SCO1
MNPKPRALILALFLTCFAVACHRNPPTAAKRYPFTGRVVSIDSKDESAVIDGDNIPGFMEAMAMSYKIKPSSMLSQLAVGDSISAEVVVEQPENQNEAVPDYWLENIKVTAHGKTPGSPANPASPTSQLQRIPAPGDEVPNVMLTNQDGKHVPLPAYRGQVLLLTFIYTRCPFPDYCPRVSGKFAEVYRQFRSDPKLAKRAHLLSVSFDPEHDTPTVLRDYAFSVAHTRDRSLFNLWEFATPRTADLPAMAQFFGLIYKPEDGLITHNLSTTVIGPDGKIIKWYQGSDWQAADLIADVKGAKPLKLGTLLPLPFHPAPNRL